MSDGGKGSSPRPFSVSNEEYAVRWDAIFSRDLKNKELVDSSEKSVINQSIQVIDGIRFPGDRPKNN
jgi:hypothetical protein